MNLVPNLRTFYSIYSAFCFPLFTLLISLLASSIFLLFRPFPFYQNSPTPDVVAARVTGDRDGFRNRVTLTFDLLTSVSTHTERLL